MRWVWRRAMLCVGGLFSLFFVALATSPPVDRGCPFGMCLIDPALENVQSQIRIIDCTSIDLTAGPFLPESVQSEVVRRVRANGPPRAPHLRPDRSVAGELRYSPSGELQSVSIQPWTIPTDTRRRPEPLPRFEISADSELFYPLTSRRPLGACESSTLVTFRCPSDGSRCQLGAQPVAI